MSIVEMSDNDQNLIYIYVLAPITAIVAIGVITYITIQGRKLRQEMLESGQLVNVVPAVISVNRGEIHSRIRHEDIRSPDGLPPPPPYSKY